MFNLIQKQGSFWRSMALVNTDGSVANEWPIDIVDGNDKPISNYGSNGCLGSPMYGPLQIGKEEPVNIQFDNFGINFSPNDTSSASHTSRIGGNEENIHYYSLSNKFKKFDGLAKDLN